MVGWERGRPVYPPADRVAELSVPDVDANGYAKAESEDRRHGGHWFPVAGEPGEPEPDPDGQIQVDPITEYVDSKTDIPRRDIIQYPREDREPERANGEDAPQDINDRHVDATLGSSGSAVGGSDV